MTLRQAELDAMRAAQEKTTLADECRIEERTRGAYNETTFSYSHAATVIYEGRCDLELVNDLRTEIPEFGEASRVERRWNLAVPSDVTTVKEGHVAVITKARDPHAPRELNVTLVPAGGFTTRRVLVCKEID